jgi:hypothetical protein
MMVLSKKMLDEVSSSRVLRPWVRFSSSSVGLLVAVTMSALSGEAVSAVLWRGETRLKRRETALRARRWVDRRAWRESLPPHHSGWE